MTAERLDPTELGGVLADAVSLVTSALVESDNEQMLSALRVTRFQDGETLMHREERIATLLVLLAYVAESFLARWAEHLHQDQGAVLRAFAEEIARDPKLGQH